MNVECEVPDLWLFPNVSGHLHLGGGVVAQWLIIEARSVIVRRLFVALVKLHQSSDWLIGALSILFPDLGSDVITR